MAQSASAGINARYNTLTPCFFVACGAIYLPSQIKPRQLFCFQSMFKHSLRINVVIIYNICWRKYFCIFESRNEIDHLNLCFERQPRAQTIWVDHIGVYALLLQPNKMLITIRKLDELLFNGWAVSWSFDYIPVVAV